MENTRTVKMANSVTMKTLEGRRREEEEEFVLVQCKLQEHDMYG